MRNDENLHKLVLGTAQFGLDYGISNVHGQLSQNEVDIILKIAANAGLTTLDTATAYGASETSIGRALLDKVSFNIITKYPPNQPEVSLEQALEASLQRLEVHTVYGYLLHSFSTYKANPDILNQLLSLKKLGKVSKIGVSVYHPDEAEELLSQDVVIDIIQFPYSVFDRRFESILPKLRDRGIETHARSIYLQGLYFMQPNTIPESLQKAAPKVITLQNLAAKYKVPLGAMLMGFVLHNSNITNVVIGVESPKTLQENIDFSKTHLSEEIYNQLHGLEERDEEIVLPYKWLKV